MAGIQVPQYEIFKIGTKKLKYADWDLKISEEEARKHNEIVALFEGQIFRIIGKILKKPLKNIQFKDYILSVFIEKIQHFDYVTRSDGIKVNGITYKRFLGTSGGLKRNTLLLINEEILNELNIRCDCGRNMAIPIVPAKLEAYKALTCSASQRIVSPRKILVVTDAEIEVFNQQVEFLDNTETDTPKLTHLDNYSFTNNATDGYSLCTIDYMEKVSKSLGLNYITHGICLRNAWFKGMLYPFPIEEFVNEFSPGNWLVKDIWGDMQDLREVELITTESSLKLWSSYKSIDDYLSKTRENGYGFAVTKIISPEMDDERKLNYQYLQSYDFTDKDIQELCEPTINRLKAALGGDYKATLSFLGISHGVRPEDKGNWQEGLLTNEKLLGDGYVLDSIFKMIRHEIDRTKIGKLLVEGNYQVCSGDPVIFMQHVLSLPLTGLLYSGECYSRYWVDKGINDVVVYRSPMLVHNNICRMSIPSTKDTDKWYKYMDTCLIINGFDTTYQALSGADNDGDICFTTNNSILLKRYKELPAIICQQKNADKIIPTEEDMIKVEKNGMGNKVGSITNRITAMLERIVNFEQGSPEYEELNYRCICGQMYQQDEIDKLKGIISNPMPSSWYNYRGCNGDNFLKSICAEKKPYFMIYIYDDYKIKYKKYEEEANYTALNKTGKTLQEIKNTINRNSIEQEFYDDYLRWHPFGLNPCTMNRICWYVEKEFKGIISKQKKKYHFDYKDLLYNISLSQDVIDYFLRLSKDYQSAINNLTRNGKRLSFELESLEKQHQSFTSRYNLKAIFKSKAKEICPNDEERMDTILTLAYSDQCSKQFCWDMIGDLIVERLSRNEENNI